jgi:4-hydroxybenzoate polyprenyltransferase
VATTAVRARPTAWLVALRPRQWTKNLLVYAAIIFAGDLRHGDKLLAATGAFVVYCAASSAAYLLNDVRDVEHDRVHPVKRDRPIASGLVAPRAALVAAVGLGIGAFALAAVLGRWSVLVLAAFVALQLGYSLGLKHVVLIDVMAIAGLFVVRAVAGAVAVHVPISPWLLLCTGLLALFLALAKRRGELVLVGADRTPGRPVLEGYSLALVDQLVTIVAASTVIAYALYTFTARPGERMMATIPFVVFGVFRYLLLVHREDAGEEPEHVLLSDRPILVCVALWALTAALLLIRS